MGITWAVLVSIIAGLHLRQVQKTELWAGLSASNSTGLFATTGIFVLSVNCNNLFCNAKRCISTPAIMSGCFEEFIIVVVSAKASCIEFMSVSDSSSLVVLEYLEESTCCS